MEYVAIPKETWAELGKFLFSLPYGQVHKIAAQLEQLSRLVDVVDEAAATPAVSSAAFAKE